MDAQGNPCALKGGTALRFALGLPRPSTDLDFEGDNRVKVKKSVKRALRKGLREEKFKVGIDWGKLGTIKLRRSGWSRRGRPELKIDYRLTGTFTGMPAKTPLEKTEVRDGIRMYKREELVRRKLQTIIGDSPRVLPRDVYDAGWLATTHPELIARNDAYKLKEWVQRTIETGEVEDIKADLKEDPVTGRVNADTVWERVQEGISRLEAGPTLDDKRPKERNDEQRDSNDGKYTDGRQAAVEELRHAQHRPLSRDGGTDAKKSEKRTQARDQQAQRIGRALTESSKRTPERRSAPD